MLREKRASKEINSEKNTIHSNEWGIKPDLSLDYDHGSLIEASSFITMDTKDLTDISDDSMIKDDHPLTPKITNTGLFAKLFACGTTAVGCIEFRGDNDDFDRTSRMFEKEKVEKMTREYKASVHRRGVADQGGVETGDALYKNMIVKPVVNSKVVAKTKLYPGFEVSNNQGNDKVSKNSTSRAIKDMMKSLKGKKMEQKAKE